MARVPATTIDETACGRTCPSITRTSPGPMPVRRGAGDPPAEAGDPREGEEERRQAHQAVSEAHGDGVGPPTEEPPDRPDERPHRRRDEGGHEADSQRAPGAEHT